MVPMHISWNEDRSKGPFRFQFMGYGMVPSVQCLYSKHFEKRRFPTSTRPQNYGVLIPPQFFIVLTWNKCRSNLRRRIIASVKTVVKLQTHCVLPIYFGSSGGNGVSSIPFCLRCVPTFANTEGRTNCKSGTDWTTVLHFTTSTFRAVNTASI